MNIQTYREMDRSKSARWRFCKWLNEHLHPAGLGISVPYLRDVESGRRIPSLALAIAIEDLTMGSVKIRDWDGLARRRKRTFDSD